VDKIISASALVDLFGKLMVPLIAAIALYIAYQQWLTNSQKLKLDLFERRYLIYKNVMNIIRDVTSKANANYEHLSEFHNVTEGAEFLFGSDVNSYLEGLRLNLIKSAFLTQRYNSHVSDKHPKENIQQINDETHLLRLWFDDQFSKCQKKFSKYLDLHTS
jgi:hypothetical protein